MAVLKLGAVDLDYASGIVQQCLSRRLYDASFARSCGPEKQKVPDRTPSGREPSHVNLIGPDDLVNCFLLSNDEAAEFVLQILRRLCRSVGVE